MFKSINHFIDKEHFFDCHFLIRINNPDSAKFFRWKLLLLQIFNKIRFISINFNCRKRIFAFQALQKSIFQIQPKII
jgi:hypothetical protein